MRRIAPLCMLLWVCLLGFGWAHLGCYLMAEAAQTITHAQVAKPFQHSLWERLLQTHTDSQGYLDFARLKAQPKLLNQYLKLIARVSPKSHPEWFPSWQHRLAYWLNAHNALSLRLRLDAYPGLNEAPQDRSKLAYLMQGDPQKQPHGIDAHIHQAFAFVPWAGFALTHYDTASAPIYPHAYVAATLEPQLEEQALRSSQSHQMLRFDPELCGPIELSTAFLQSLGVASNLKNPLMDPLSEADQDLVYLRLRQLSRLRAQRGLSAIPLACSPPVHRVPHRLSLRDAWGLP